jgi:large subunit ribosomal protein L43
MLWVKYLLIGRSYLKSPMIKMAEANPDVEVLIRRLRRGKAAVVRGHYGESSEIVADVVNGRDKVICVNGLETNQISNKAGDLVFFTNHQVDLLLSSSGAKIKPLHTLTLEAAPGGASARGIWSALHDETKPGGGYRI